MFDDLILIFKLQGVVYNEMKGVMVLFGSVMWWVFGKVFYFDFIYVNNFGGFFEDIFGLMYEDLWVFYVVYYYLLNVYFFSYGNQDLCWVLDIIEEQVMLYFQW